ncbi:hypothetical protein IMAU10382_03078 [Lactiplantibacillus plantarum]|nr:hypothetical protein [Lactiplantibacillus plantarum]
MLEIYFTILPNVLVTAFQMPLTKSLNFLLCLYSSYSPTPIAIIIAGINSHGVKAALTSLPAMVVKCNTSFICLSAITVVKIFLATKNVVSVAAIALMAPLLFAKAFNPEAKLPTDFDAVLLLFDALPSGLTKNPSTATTSLIAAPITLNAIVRLLLTMLPNALILPAFLASQA